MGESQSEENSPKITGSRLHVDLDQLSSKQRGAVLGLLKDIGFSPGEIRELVVVLPTEVGACEPSEGKKHRKRK